MADLQDAIRLSRRAAERLRAGHLWVYRTEFDEAAVRDLAPGALTTVADAAGRLLGTALYSTASKIAFRIVSAAPQLTRESYLTEIGHRLHAAVERRRIIAPLGRQPGHLSNAQRLVFSEADALPGVVIDRYADLVILQLLTQGTAQDDVRSALVETLRETLAPERQPLTIWERPDPRVRELEQLPLPSPGALFTNAPEGKAPTRTEFSLNGLRFEYDAAAGQKTGAFLDQRLNYAAAADWVRRSERTGHALDICTYHGGFALHLARICERVTGVDQSRSALEVADRNLGLNDLRANVDWVEADAFEFLRALDDASRESSVATAPKRKASGLPTGLPERFDAIVLDPPAFAKSKRAAEDALRGYKELNLRAMRLLAPGGTLVTCSCSHHVSPEAFTATIASAAADAGRRVQLLEWRFAATDHPQVLTLPETSYLKCLVFRAE